MEIKLRIKFKHMKATKLFAIALLLSFIACKQETPSDQLKTIIQEYEKPREYDFNRTESVENTIKYYQAESDFSVKLKEKLTAVSPTNLSETDKISRELLLFVLQDKIEDQKYL